MKLRQPTPPVLVLLTLASTAIACGEVDSRAAMASPDETLPAPAHQNSGSPTAPTSLAADATAPEAGGPPQPPRCSVDVAGATTLAWSNDQVSARLDESGGLELTCTFVSGGILYQFAPTISNITGPGSYPADQVWLHRDCQLDSCPGDFDFAAYAPQATCTFQVERFLPATRGGMKAIFACPSLLIQDFEDSSDVKSVSLSGSIDLPPAVPTAPPLMLDAGSNVVASDAGAATCALHLSGAYGDVTAPGYGDAIETDGPDASDQGTCDCAGSANGVAFGIEATFGPSAEGPVASAMLSVFGASWCSYGCSMLYAGSSPCAVTVLVNEGTNGRFKATYACGALAPAIAFADSAEPSLTVTGSIDTILSEPPPPK